jgi:putative transposase
MTLPRPIVPGKTYLVSRRCTQRQFLLKPTRIVCWIVLFCLAYAAHKTGMLIHAYCVMSNHLHIVVTDPYGRLPEFVEWVHKYIAKCLNLFWGRWENLWSSEKPSYVELIDSVDVMDKIVYVLSNPVSSHLVARSHQWPGLISRPGGYLLDPQCVRRPNIYFRPNGPVPESVDLNLTVPPMVSHIPVRDFVCLLQKELKKKENRELRKLSQNGGRVLGRKKVLAQSHLDTPESDVPHGTLSPRVAGKNKWRRLETLRRLKSFILAYREARKKYNEGDRHVEFPPGTYWLKRFGGVACGALVS